MRCILLAERRDRYRGMEYLWMRGSELLRWRHAEPLRQRRHDGRGSSLFADYCDSSSLPMRDPRENEPRARIGLHLCGHEATVESDIFRRSCRLRRRLAYAPREGDVGFLWPLPILADLPGGLGRGLAQLAVRHGPWHLRRLLLPPPAGPGP